MTTLLLHPIALDRTTWSAVPIHDALAVDFPGHGAEPMNSARSVEDLADHLADSLSVAHRVDVVGISLGGMVALQLALRHPGLVRSLVVACAPAATPTDVMAQRANDTESLGMAAIVPSMIDRWFSARFAADRGEVTRSVTQRLLSDDPAVVAQYWRILSRFDVRDRLAELSLPTTVLAGGADVSTPPPVARALAEGIAGARYVELPGAHMLHLENPGGFAEAVAHHLEGLQS